ENMELYKLEHAQKNNISRVYDGVRDMKEGIEKRIGAVMSELARNQADVETEARGEQGDIAVRLGLVRQAVGHFLSLWRDFSAVMSSKFQRFHQADAEFIEQLDAQVRHELAKSEDVVVKAMEKVNTVHKELDKGYEEEEAFEKYMQEHIAKLQERQRAIHENRNELLLKAKAELADLQRKQEKMDAEERQYVRDNIAQFEDDMTKKANQPLPVQLLSRRMVRCCRLITALGTATALCTVAVATAASEDDTLDVDDGDISALLAHRAHRPRAGDDEISRLVADYSDLGTEEELMEIVRKVDARAEMALIYKARRRRGEPAGVRACEMLGVYSDADNYDCHIRRYKMIREQFGPEQEVHDKGKDVRVKANTLAEDWNKAETTLDRLMQYTYGQGGTKAEPSTKDGLTHKIGLASAALYELHSATVTAADEIWADFDKIHFGYAADIDDLKSSAVNAFNSLVSGVQSVVAGQANDQMANQLRLNQDANDKLTKLARGINEIQVKVERAARGVQHQKDTLESTAEKTLVDAEDTLTNIADELAEVPVKDIEERDKVADEIRSDLRKTEDEGEAELKKHVAGYEEKANKQTKQLEEATKKQIENQASDWQAEEDNRRKSLDAKLQGERQELELAQGSVANSLASAKEKAALQEQEFQKKRAGRWGEFQKLAEDIGLTREELEMMVKNVGTEIETGAHELEEEANRGQAGIKNAISEKMSAAGGGVAGILGSLFSALAGAEQDIYGASEGAKEEVLKNIRKTMQENGMETSKMGQVLGEFIDGVLKGEKATAADLQAKLKGIDHETGKVSDDLQGGVMHLVDSLNQNAARSSLQAYGIKKDIEGSLHAGMNGLDGKLAGLSHSMLSDEEDTAGKMNKGLHTILSQIGGVGSSAHGLLQSLMGLSHDESQLKGDALDGERRVYTNQQRLARQLAQTLFGLGAQLMQFLGGSESSLVASMHNEDLKARKEFGLLTGEYGLGIKDYEGAGREGYAELQSRLGNEKARARALEGDLKRTEEEMERLQRGEQLNLDDEKKAYENYLSQNTAKAGAELEGIRAKLVGDEGQIEREMRDQMDAASQRSEQDARKRESEADRAINAAERRLQAERSDDANVRRKLEEDSDRFERDKEGSDGELESVTKSINGEGDKFKGDYKRLLDEFSEMKGKEQGDLNRLTENFKKRVDALPKTVAAKMDELQRGFYASHAAIGKKISELRHQASNAESEEEREAAKKNLEALERMKEFAVKVKEADDAMKAKILR
ncbi:hypothetical protein FOZ62_014905, partial [Perkinsus olseni]